MQLAEAVALLQHPTSGNKTIWADLGCGEGLFTNALSHLLPAESTIYAVDKNKSALNKVIVKDEIKLVKIVSDFIKDELPFENLSGLLMANSFHYVRDKQSFIQKLLKYLSADGYFVIVEYDTNFANTWVPYPISFNSVQQFFLKFGLLVKLLNKIPSRYNRSIYSAIAEKNFEGSSL